MRKIILIVGLSLPVLCGAQGGIIHGNGDPRVITPTPNCASSRFYVDDSTQIMYLAGTGSPCTWVVAGAAGSGITALTGDVTASGPGSAASTLAASGVTAGSYTCANVTLDAKGRTTSAANGTCGGGLASIGNIYSASTWADLSAFNQSGATPAIVAAGVDSCPAGTNSCLEFSGGTDSYIASLDVNSFTTSNSASAAITAIVGTKGATSYGLGLGLRPWNAAGGAGNGVGYVFKLDMTTAGTSGQISFAYLNGNTPTTNVSTSATALTLTAGDKVVLQVTRFYDFVQATAYDLTTGATPVTLQVQFPYAPSSLPPPPTVGKWAIFNQGGTQTVTSVLVNSQQYSNVDLVVMGDSKALSQNPSYVANSPASGVHLDNGEFGMGWANQLGTTAVAGATANSTTAFFNGTGLRIVNESSSGATTAEGLLWLPEVIALKPKVVIMALGRNDISGGVFPAQSQTNYASIVSQLQAAGITVYLLPVIYETLISQASLQTWVAANYSNSLIIPDPLVAWSASSAILNTDQIHPTQFGHSIVAQGVTNFLISKQLGFNYIPYPMVPRNALSETLGQYNNYNHQLQAGLINSGPAANSSDTFAFGTNIPKATAQNVVYGHLGQSTDSSSPSTLDLVYGGNATANSRSQTMRLCEGATCGAQIAYGFGGTLGLNQSSSINGFNMVTTGNVTVSAVPFVQGSNITGTTGGNNTVADLGYTNEASSQSTLSLFFTGNATAALRLFGWNTRIAGSSTGILGLQNLGGNITMGNNASVITESGLVYEGATAFTVSGCGTAGSITAQGGTAGSFTVGTGANPCTFTVTLNGATGLTAAHGWIADADDTTTGTHCVNSATVSTTTVLFVCNFAVGTSDVIKFVAFPY